MPPCIAPDRHAARRTEGDALDLGALKISQGGESERTVRRGCHYQHVADEVAPRACGQQSLRLGAIHRFLVGGGEYVDRSPFGDLSQQSIRGREVKQHLGARVLGLEQWTDLSERIGQAGRGGYRQISGVGKA
jgi:hypothetical protein